MQEQTDLPRPHRFIPMQRVSPSIDNDRRLRRWGLWRWLVASAIIVGLSAWLMSTQKLDFPTWLRRSSKTVPAPIGREWVGVWVMANADLPLLEIKSDNGALSGRLIEGDRGHALEELIVGESEITFAVTHFTYQRTRYRLRPLDVDQAELSSQDDVEFLVRSYIQSGRRDTLDPFATEHNQRTRENWQQAIRKPPPTIILGRMQRLGGVSGRTLTSNRP